MKRILCMAAVLATAVTTFAQKDTSNPVNNGDTVKVGNFIIIKKDKDNSSHPGIFKIEENDEEGIKINIDDKTKFYIGRKKGKNKNLSTNWWIFDLGFANFRDNTNYGYAQAGTYFKNFRPADGLVNESSYRLRTGKSTNVNIWFFMQKLNISKNVLNLKYGLGLEMYNFRYDSRISLRKDPQSIVYNDSIGFSKNKLYVGYLTVPLMVHINTTPNKHNGFSFSGGLSAGYLLNSRNKQISAERGKQKYKNDFDFEPWRFAAIGELGIGPVRLYGSYSLNKLQKDITRLEQFPYAVGIRFSNW